MNAPYSARAGTLVRPRLSRSRRIALRKVEARLGFAVAYRAFSRLGPYRGPQASRGIEARHGWAGTRRTFGGHIGPPGPTGTRGAPRLAGGAPNVWGLGGHIGAPQAARGI